MQNVILIESLWCYCPHLLLPLKILSSIFINFQHFINLYFKNAKNISKMLKINKIINIVLKKLKSEENKNLSFKVQCFECFAFLTI
jgi:hypothetical protein